MKSLTQYIVESLINEGGKAVENCVPMTQPQCKEVFNDVVKKLFPKLGLEHKDTEYAPLGSFGKKAKEQTSGDIDIAVSIETIANFLMVPLEEVENAIIQVCENEKIEYKYSKGLHVISLGWPIPGTDNKGQVDLMPSNNMEFSTWIYHSPDFTKAESKYKGLYRNEFMRVICHNADRKILSKNEKDEVMEYERYALNYSDGISKAIKSYIGKKGRLKNPTTIKDSKKIITNTPQDIIDFIFGKGHKAKDIMTFEKAYEIFMSKEFPWKDKREVIIEEYLKELKQRQAPIPEEIYNNWKDIVDKFRKENNI
jgi:hypothetical protein